jgi:hypothetical protein
MGLQVELPVILEIDNKGAVELATAWITDRRTRHVDVWQNFLGELKEDSILRVTWMSVHQMTLIFIQRILPNLTLRSMWRLIPVRMSSRI